MTIDNTSLDGAVRQVGDRWSLRVIGALLDRDLTFSELSAEVDGIAPNILAARLRSLKRDGLVAARPYQQRPVRMRYSLTVPGRRLADALSLLAQWGANRGGKQSARHEACGSALQLRQWCPTCEVAVDAGAVDELVWV